MFQNSTSYIHRMVETSNAIKIAIKFKSRKKISRLRATIKACTSSLEIFKPKTSESTQQNGWEPQNFQFSTITNDKLIFDILFSFYFLFNSFY